MSEAAPIRKRVGDKYVCPLFEYGSNVMGVTADNKLVLAGEIAFNAHDRLGLPWEMVFGEIDAHGHMVDWQGLFLLFASNYMWDLKRCWTEVEHAIGDVWGTKFKEALYAGLFRRTDD